MAQRTIAGRYELTEPLGSGWRARDTELERDVVVRLGATADVRATALAHPNIARIFDQGEADGERYVVSEYLPGGSLEEQLPDLSEDEAHAVAADVAGALAYAHAQGVAHGSLSQACVLFDSEGRAKVAGFGAGGEPEDDVRAFGAILDSLARTAPALAPIAAAALAGELASADLLERIPRVERTPPVAEDATLIQRPTPTSSRRGPIVLLTVAAAAVVAGGLLAAFLATSGDSNANDPTTASLSVPVPTGSTESTTAQTEAPPTTETSETTTEQTTPATTESQPTTAPTTAPPPATTTTPSPTTAPPPTTEPPPPTTTEAPPPTTTAETTAATTAPG